MAVVGIDLGTTNTVVACVRSGRVHVLPDEQGRRLLPSVVSFHPSGEVLVGYPAKERRVVDARNTIASVKRLIGRAWGSDEIRRARQRFAFELKEGPGQGPLVVSRGQEYTLPEISAFVLRRAKELSERAVGEIVDKAVITVPANFNELQRAATKVAGRVAGLDVLRIINEPTAAALAYGLGRTTKERIAIYDFGGGTFDCTLLDLSGNVFEVLATAGDTFLGGDDLDMAIAERMSEAFLHTHRYDPRTDSQAFERLRVAAEAVKIDLSSRDRTHTRLREVAFGVGGAHLDLDFGMTRDELEMLATPLVERTFAVCQEALSVARLPVTGFDKIILVGGSTRIPLVRRRVEQFFGTPPMDRVNPDEVVAIGAAIQAAALTEVSRRRSIPPPPTPASARPRYSSHPSLHGDDDENTADDVTLATKVTALMAEREKMRPMAPTSPEVPRTTARMGGPPPLPGGQAPQAPHAPQPPLATRTARMPGVPEPGVLTRTGPMPSARLASTQVLGSQSPVVPPAPPTDPDPASTIPKPLVFDEVLRAERASMSGAPISPRPVYGLGSTQPLPERPHVPAAPPSEPPPALAAAIVTTHPGVAPNPFAAPPGVASNPFASAPPAALEPPPPHTAIAPVGTPLPPAMPAPLTPVLVDVTPRALVVETVGGWCDVVVQRNAKIPCDRTRAFATSSDMQTTVRVRVAQGEDATFGSNTYLGEVELSGLRPAARGQVTIQVRFEVDESGTLKVFATDASTGRQANAVLQLVGLTGGLSVAEMAARHAAMRMQ
ncbi:MAG TPA: Hsp70 family protein [Polyangiaceae bacterium]|jgi:molecular chaperone DnaK